MTLIRFDECINPRIVDAIKAIGFQREDVQLETPQELAQRGLSDVNWIEDFGGRGGRLIVSGDGNMRRVHLERAALEASGVVAVFPHMKWYSGLGRWGQAAFFMAWFPALVRLAKEAEAGAHFRIPTSLSGDFSSLEPLRSLADIERDRMQKAAEKAAERAAENDDGSQGDARLSRLRERD